MQCGCIYYKHGFFKLKPMACLFVGWLTASCRYEKCESAFHTWAGWCQIHHEDNGKPPSLFGRKNGVCVGQGGGG